MTIQSSTYERKTRGLTDPCSVAEEEGMLKMNGLDAAKAAGWFSATVVGLSRVSLRENLTRI